MNQSAQVQKTKTGYIEAITAQPIPYSANQQHPNLEKLIKEAYRDK